MLEGGDGRLPVAQVVGRRRQPAQGVPVVGARLSTLRSQATASACSRPRTGRGPSSNRRRSPRGRHDESGSAGRPPPPASSAPRPTGPGAGAPGRGSRGSPREVGARSTRRRAPGVEISRHARPGVGRPAEPPGPDARTERGRQQPQDTDDVPPGRDGEEPWVKRFEMVDLRSERSDPSRPIIPADRPGGNARLSRRPLRRPAAGPGPRRSGRRRSAGRPAGA